MRKREEKVRRGKLGRINREGGRKERRNREGKVRDGESGTA